MAVPQVPLLPEQVEAVQVIYHSYVPLWRRTDDALTALRESMPGFDSSAILIKAAAVDNLYGTSVYHLGSVALRVEEALQGVAKDSVGPELVEEMAAVRLPGGKIIRYRSFASKFAHFFIDHDRFPIHDSFAAKMLRAHLGNDAPAVDSGATYMRIEEAFRRLAGQVGLGSDTRQLDRYLWMIGQYRDWANHPRASINAELRSVFEVDPSELRVAAGGWYRPAA